MITLGRLLQSIPHKISNLQGETVKYGDPKGIALGNHKYNLSICTKCRLKQLRLDETAHVIGEMSPIMGRAVESSHGELREQQGSIKKRSKYDQEQNS